MMSGSSSQVRDALLQQSAKFVIGQPRVPNDVAHRDRMDGIVAGYREGLFSVRHDDMFALTINPPADLFEGTNGIHVVDSGQFRHSQTSTSRIIVPCTRALTDSRYSRMASAMFSRASSSVAPCE